MADDNRTSASQVSIVGLSHLGISVGLALKAAETELTIVGYDDKAELAQKAKDELNALDKVESRLSRAVSSGDIVVLVTMPADVEDKLAQIGRHLQPHALLLDLSSLKGRSTKWAEQFIEDGHYVGARPVYSADYLERGTTDWRDARADLFKNSIFCVMPGAEAHPQAVQTAVNFGTLLGAVPYFVDPYEFDGLNQSVETLPTLVGAALFSAVSRSESWRDILRFAGLPFAHATEGLTNAADVTALAMDNRLATLRWLDMLSDELKLLRKLVQEKDPDSLTAILDDAVGKRNKWLREREENNWVEIQAPEIEKRTMSQQLFGDLAAGRRRRGS